MIEDFFDILRFLIDPFINFIVKEEIATNFFEEIKKIIVDYSILLLSYNSITSNISPKDNG